MPLDFDKYYDPEADPFDDNNAVASQKEAYLGIYIDSHRRNLEYHHLKERQRRRHEEQCLRERRRLQQIFRTQHDLAEEEDVIFPMTNMILERSTKCDSLPTLDDMVTFINDNWRKIADQKDKIRNVREPKLKDMITECNEKGRCINGVQVDECVAAVEQWINGFNNSGEMQEDDITAPESLSDDVDDKIDEGDKVSNPSEINSDVYTFRAPVPEMCDLKKDPCIILNIAGGARRGNGDNAERDDDDFPRFQGENKPEAILKFIFGLGDVSDTDQTSVQPNEERNFTAFPQQIAPSKKEMQSANISSFFPSFGESNNANKNPTVTAGAVPSKHERPLGKTGTCTTKEQKEENPVKRKRGRPPGKYGNYKKR